MKKSVVALSLILTYGANAQKSEEAKCPFHFGSKSKSKAIAAEKKMEGAVGDMAPSNRMWWPNQLDLSVLRQNSNLSDPMNPDLITARSFLLWIILH